MWPTILKVEHFFLSWQHLDLEVVFVLKSLSHLSFTLTFFVLTLRLISDATVEKDESHPGKVLKRYTLKHSSPMRYQTFLSQIEYYEYNIYKCNSIVIFNYLF